MGVLPCGGPASCRVALASLLLHHAVPCIMDHVHRGRSARGDPAGPLMVRRFLRHLPTLTSCCEVIGWEDFERSRD